VIRVATQTAHDLGEQMHVYSGPAWTGVINTSRVNLSPRGFGRAAYRTYEVLQMGRLPVLVHSDLPWVPYAGIFERVAWSTSLGGLSALLKQIYRIPDAELEQRERLAASMRSTHWTMLGVLNHIFGFLNGTQSDLRCQPLPGSVLELPCGERDKCTKWPTDRAMAEPLNDEQAQSSALNATSPARRDVLLVVFSNRANLSEPEHAPTGFAWRLNEVYAARWGYATRLITKRVGPTSHHIAYQKIHAISSGLRDGYSAVVCTDDDGFINDHDTPVEHFTDALTDAGRDVLVPVIPATGKTVVEVANAGVFIVRNTEWSRQFFGSFTDRCNGPKAPNMFYYNGSGMPCGYGCHEQQCLFNMMHAAKGSRSHYNVSQHIAIMGAAELSCIPTHISYNGRCDPWHVHFLGWTKLLIFPMVQRRGALGRKITSSEMFSYARALFAKNTRCATWANPLLPHPNTSACMHTSEDPRSRRRMPLYHVARNPSPLKEDDEQCRMYRMSARFRCFVWERENQKGTSRRLRVWHTAVGSRLTAGSGW